MAVQRQRLVPAAVGTDGVGEPVRPPGESVPGRAAGVDGGRRHRLGAGGAGRGRVPARQPLLARRTDLEEAGRDARERQPRHRRVQRPQREHDARGADQRGVAELPGDQPEPEPAHPALRAPRDVLRTRCDITKSGTFLARQNTNLTASCPIRGSRVLRSTRNDPELMFPEGFRNCG